MNMGYGFISKNQTTQDYVIIAKEYCPFGHTSNDIFFNYKKNYIEHSNGGCYLCTKEHFIKEFEIWTSGNVEIDKVIQESQTSNPDYFLQWISCFNFQDITHIASGGYGFVYSATLKNGIKNYWNFNKQNWEYEGVGKKVALKEIRGSGYDISEFLKEVCSRYLDNKLI